MELIWKDLKILGKRELCFNYFEDFGENIGVYSGSTEEVSGNFGKIFLGSLQNILFKNSLTDITLCNFKLIYLNVEEIKKTFGKIFLTLLRH